MTLGTLISAEDLFDELDGERREELKDFSVRKSPIIDEMIRVFYETCLSKFCSYGCSLEILERVKLKPRAEDIELLSLVFPKAADIAYKGSRTVYYNYDCGFYLSALCNKCEDDEINIFTKNMEHFPSSLGSENNGKRIIVHGNVFTCLGNRMSSGEIIVKGDAGPALGSHMSGGKIIVEGKVEDIGAYMNGGEIYFNDEKNVFISPNMCMGRIYLKGKLIYENGEDLR